MRGDEIEIDMDKKIKQNGNHEPVARWHLIKGNGYVKYILNEYKYMYKLYGAYKPSSDKIVRLDPDGPIVSWRYPGRGMQICSECS